MIEKGVFLPPSQFEAWFLSTEFSEKDMSKTKIAIYKGMKAVSSRFVSGINN